MTLVSGIIPVFKPTGMTSKDVSRTIVRRFGKLKIGHVGTLDPDADGVLPVLIGSATKLQDYLLDIPKAYTFTIKLGKATDTLDASGVVTESQPYAHITEKAILDKLTGFLGKIKQIPPLYSAVKLEGRELYKHARSGVNEVTRDELARLHRHVTVYSIFLVSFIEDEIILKIDCSKGTYVRTIADDLCRSLGSVGHVIKLRRDTSAGLHLKQCVTLEDLVAESATLERYLVPFKNISIGLPIWLSDDNLLIRRIKDGQRIALTATEFVKGVTFDEADEIYEKKVFLIRDKSNSNVGIGELLDIVNDQNESHQVVIHLKRGL